MIVTARTSGKKVRSKKTSRKKTSSSNSQNIKKEMWGIILLGFAILLGGALLSLQLGDGTLMGPFGQLLALGLYALLGMGGYLAIIALFSVAWGIFSNRFTLKSAKLWLGYTGATFMGTILLYLLFPSYRLHGLSSGGKTGEVLGNIGISMFSKVGTFLISSVFMMVFLMLATKVSPVKGTVAIIGGLANLLKFLLNLLISLFASIASIFTWTEEEEFDDDDEVKEEFDEEDEVKEEVFDDDDEVKEENQKIKKSRKSKNQEKNIVQEELESTNSDTKLKESKNQEKNIVQEVKNQQKTLNSNTKELGSVETSQENDQSNRINTEIKQEAQTSSDEKSVSEPHNIINNQHTKQQSSSSSIISEISDTPKIVETDLQKQPEMNFDLLKPETEHFSLPDPELLQYKKPENIVQDKETMINLAFRVEEALSDYKIKGKVKEIHPGPVVTMYEYAPESGIRVSKIESLNKDLAMSLAATRVRIVAPIPGKSAVGIEVPNKKRQTVYLKEIIGDKKFAQSDSKLTVVLGKNIKGNSVVCDLAKAPHLLVAGATGSGKSVGINAMIMSILFRATPEEVKLIMIDPKMVELSIYNDIPHLLLPVVTDPQKASLALKWAVKEMENRYQLLSELKVRNIKDFNETIKVIKEKGIESVPEKLPYIVVVIDEFADLMMVAAKDVEISVARIAQKARAVGIHLILATQRPSTDVITGLIKSNFPTRIAFMVSSRIDSKVILDKHGAETLLGNGDMLYSDRGLEPVRVHGAYVSTSEVQSVVDHLHTQGPPNYDLSIVTSPEEELPDITDEPYDSKWDLAISIVSRDRIASISYLQRKLKIGYNRSARIVERMEAEGIISPPNGTNQREVLISPPPD